jgi:hypothetical protein
MEKVKETIQILLAIIILAFCASFYMIFSKNINYLAIIITFIFMAIVIFTNILIKKMTAYHYETKIKIKLWEFQRFGYRPENKFKNPMPFGILMPFLFAIASAGNFLWMACLEFDVYSTPARGARRHGIFRFTEVTEFHMGLIALSGVVANLFLSIIAYAVGLTELSRLSVYYAVYSVIPFSSLDGTKILFGKKEIWFVISIICLIFLFASFAMI